ncbi:MAG: hypothetical protein F4082_00700 [Gammaproteobacteria bacterium]|nr:hypothetical protein [Gammaproteobacteria bacterium]
MRNITVTVDDRTHRAARIRAAELDTSVSALVRDYLRTLVYDQGEKMELSGKVSKKTRAEYRERKLGDAIANIRISSPEFSAADNLSRNTLNDQAGTNPGSIYSSGIAKDDNL